MAVSTIATSEDHGPSDLRTNRAACVRQQPFMPFDAMSYAPGLSRRHAWRFAPATITAFVPARLDLTCLASVARQGGFAPVAGKSQQSSRLQLLRRREVAAFSKARSKERPTCITRSARHIAHPFCDVVNQLWAGLFSGPSQRER